MPSTHRRAGMLGPWIVGALLLSPAPARSQSALGQLQDMCQQAGGNCNPDIAAPLPPTPTPVKEPTPRGPKQAPAPRATKAQSSPKAPTTDEVVRTQVTGMLVQGLLQAVFFSGEDAKEQAASEEATAEAAAERASLEAQQREQRAAQVRAQREARDVEVGKDLEALSAALADPWVGRGGALAAQPPAPPASTGAATVGLFDPPANPFARPSGPSRAEATAQRLATLAAENADVAVLVHRLDDLEDRLAKAQASNVAARREQRGAARGLDAAAGRLEAAVDAAYERGASLALTTLFHVTPKAQARLDAVRSDSRAWNTLNELLHGTAEPASAIKDAAEKVENFGSDIERLKAARDFRRDALYLAKRLGGDYAEVGGNILASAQSVRVSLATRKEAGRLLTQVEEQRQLGRVDAEYAKLVADVKQARTAVARATGVDRQDLVRTAAPQGRAKGLASDVPHPLDN